MTKKRQKQLLSDCARIMGKEQIVSISQIKYWLWLEFAKKVKRYEEISAQKRNQ